MKLSVFFVLLFSMLHADSPDYLLHLSEDEKSYLDDKKALNICIDPSWMPFEAFRDGKYIGLSSDYFKIFQKKLHIPINVVYTNTWKETLKYAETRKCDIVSLITKTPTREKYLSFTTPLVKTPIVLATRLQESFVVDFHTLEEKTLAIPHGYAIAEILYKKYPNLHIIEVANIEEGLLKVKNGEVYGLIGTLATIGYKIQKEFLGELKIGGKFDETLSVPIGARNDEPQLVAILQKLLDTFSEEEHYNILNKWITITIEQKQDYTVVWWLISFFLVVLFIVFLVVQKQHREKDKKLLEHSQEMQDKLNASLELLNHNVLSSRTDINGITTFVSDALCRLNGYTKEEMIGYPLSLVQHSDLSQELSSEIYTAIKSGTTWTGEVKSRKKDASTYWAKVSIVPTYDNANVLNGSMCIKHDITAQKIKEEFMANMSHELRTPLNAIIGFGNILSKKLKNTSNLELIHQINSSSQSLLSLINDILDLSKIEDAKFTIEMYEFHAYTETEKQIKQFEGLTVEKNIFLKSEVSEELNSIFVGDWLRVSQIVLNLISNAVKFTPENGIITYSVAYIDSSLVLTIRDNGIGMSKEVQDKIFMPFTQADGSTTRKYGGTGLGLSITQSLVELMKGKIELKSKLGEGTTFIVTIPMEKVVNTEPVQSIEYETDKEKSKLNVHVLVAEDNKTNQMLIEMLLEDMGITCDIANDGCEAVSIYNPQKHHLILMDENMPNMNGIEAMLQIQEKYKKNCGAIIALTANAMNGERERFIKLGMSEYISKPIDEDVLYKTIKRFI